MIEEQKQNQHKKRTKKFPKKPYTIGHEENSNHSNFSFERLSIEKDNEPEISSIQSRKSNS